MFWSRYKFWGINKYQILDNPEYKEILQDNKKEILKILKKESLKDKLKLTAVFISFYSMYALNAAALIMSHGAWAGLAQVFN